MKFLFLAGGLLLAATGAHAETLPNGTPVTKLSASVFLMGAPAEPKPEPEKMAGAVEPVKVSAVPVAQMTLDEIIGERPEVMNQPRSLADLGMPDGEREGDDPVSGDNVATAAAGSIPVTQAPAGIDREKTAAVEVAPPDFKGMELRRE